MNEKKSWLLKLVLPGRFGKPATGILLLCLLLPLFYLGAVDDSTETTPSLFFSLVIAYIIPVFSHITARSAEALQQLRPLIALDDEAFQHTLNRLYSTSGRHAVFDLVFGGLCGFIHMSFVSGSVTSALARLVPGAPGFASIVGALLVWIIMTTVISMLIQQALLFARLGRRIVRIPLFNSHRLLPFGRVSISSSLAILGALTLFPLIGLEGDMYMREIVPGAAAISVPLIVIFIMPVWPIHQRLADMKEKQLRAVNEKIDAFITQRRSDDGGIDPNPEFTTLLAYRREIADGATWPFDVGNVTKLALYLIIPPLTWVAAALIENLVDSVL